MSVKVIDLSMEPIELDEIKDYLRVDMDDDDILIQSMITAAREYIETYTRRALPTQQLEMIQNDFPSNEIYLPMPPLQSVESVTYKDNVGTETVLDPNDYIIDVDSTPGKIVLVYGKTWPSFTPYPVGAVKVKFTAGYNEIPKQFDQVIKLLVSHMYDNREIISNQSVNQLPFTVEALLYPHKASWF